MTLGSAFVTSRISSLVASLSAAARARPSTETTRRSHITCAIGGFLRTIVTRSSVTTFASSSVSALTTCARTDVQSRFCLPPPSITTRANVSFVSSWARQPVHASSGRTTRKSVCASIASGPRRMPSSRSLSSSIAFVVTRAATTEVRGARSTPHPRARAVARRALRSTRLRARRCAFGAARHLGRLGKDLCHDARLERKPQERALVARDVEELARAERADSIGRRFARRRLRERRPPRFDERNGAVDPRKIERDDRSPELVLRQRRDHFVRCRRATRRTCPRSAASRA